MFSSRVSRVSMPSRARRMSDWRSWRERARRRRFSERVDRGTVVSAFEGRRVDFVGEDGGFFEGDFKIDLEGDALEIRKGDDGGVF